MLHIFDVILRIIEENRGENLIFAYISRALSVFIFSGGPIGRSELNGSKYAAVFEVRGEKGGKKVGQRGAILSLEANWKWSYMDLHFF